MEIEGRIHIGSRGVALYRDWVYFETPDNYLVCLNAKDGTERWHVEIGDVRLEYFSTPAPMVIGNHIIVGTGGDSLDVPGYLEARDPKPARPSGTGTPLRVPANPEPKPGPIKTPWSMAAA